MTRLVLTGVERTYAGQVPVRALRGVDLTVEQGDYVAIEGPSGSGKSTLLNQIALLDTPTAGRYEIDGTDATGLDESSRARLRSDTFAFIFQSFHLLGRRSVLDNVALGTLYRGLPAARRRELARQALEFVGLAHKAGQRADRLSGGERQRVAIARAIAARTPVVVADEPTGNLDRATGAQVMETLERLHATGTTLIIVTHDPSLAARAPRRLKVLDGQVAERDDDGARGQTVGSPGQVRGSAPLPQPEGRGSQEPVHEEGREPTPELSQEPAAAGSQERVAAGSQGRVAAGRKAPAPEGRPATVRLRDALTDAWKGLVSTPSRTLALVASVALGVGLALATAGLSATAQAQVSDIFDAQRNQRIAMTSPAFSEHEVADLLQPASLSRLREVAGVTAAAVLVDHQEATVSPSMRQPGAAAGSDSSSSEAATGTIAPLIGLVGDQLPDSIFSLSHQGAAPSRLDPGQVLLGSQLAASIELGPLLASPVVWVDGQPYQVAGVLEDAGLQVSLLSSVIMREPEATQHNTPSWASAEVRVVAGAAPQVAVQAPLAWMPSDPGAVSVDAPPDPRGLRDEIESNLRTMLLTLTGVSLFAAVLSLTNAMTSAVFQRVGEFGLRRAIGARRLHITSLVVTESVVIGLLGGVIGAYAAVLGVLGVTLARHWQPVFDPVLLPLGLLGGVLVGLAGGALATWRASRVAPADALRS